MWRKTVWLIATLTLSILVAPVAGREGWARDPGKLYRVGLVSVRPPNLLPPHVPQPSFGRGGFARAFLDRLADHGYIQGKNLVIEARYGGYERLVELAAELVRLQVDVIYVGGTKAVRIVSAAVKETPLVILSCDPFEHFRRLAGPEGNLTGVTCMTTELSPKRLELLKEAVPNAAQPSSIDAMAEDENVLPCLVAWPRPSAHRATSRVSQFDSYVHITIRSNVR